MPRRADPIRDPTPDAVRHRANAALAEPALPNVSVAQLQYLDAVTRARTWADAADELGVTPSALSQGLAELERRLGLELFVREGRRQTLTDNGRAVAEHAARVLGQTRDLARWADRARGGETGRLRVGMIDAAAVHHFPEALRAFRAARPDVDLHLAVAPSAALLAQLARGTLDLVVCVAPAEMPDGLTVTSLRDEELGVYAPPGRRVGPPRSWGPWVAFPAGSHTRALVEAALRAEGARVDVVAESHQPEVLREMVRLGMGWAVLPIDGAERPPGPLTRARKTPLTHRTLVLARRADAPTDPAGDALAQRLSDAT